MFQLPPLPYRADALAPVMSELTLLTHHGKHHAKYVENTNGLLAKRDRRPESLEAVVRAAAQEGDQALFNNAGQAWNHAFFWACMSPRGGGPEGGLIGAVKRSFGDIQGLKTAFCDAGVGHFGSGWVWLVADGEELRVTTTHDGDCALNHPGAPLLVCDLWEHAYYLDHKNDRAGFLRAWWDRLVNWRFVADQYEAARAGADGWRFPAPLTSAHAEP